MDRFEKRVAIIGGLVVILVGATELYDWAEKRLPPGNTTAEVPDTTGTPDFVRWVLLVAAATLLALTLYRMWKQRSASRHEADLERRLGESQRREREATERASVAASRAQEAEEKAATAALTKTRTEPSPPAPLTPAQAAKTALRINACRGLNRRFAALWQPRAPADEMPSFPDLYEKATPKIGEAMVEQMRDSGHGSCAQEVRWNHEEIWHLLQLDIQRRNQELIHLLNQLDASLVAFEKNPADFQVLAHCLWETADTTGRYLAFAQFVFKSHPECAPVVKGRLEAWLVEHAKLVEGLKDFEPEMIEARYPFRNSAGLRQYRFVDFEGKKSRASFIPSGSGR